MARWTELLRCYGGHILLDVSKNHSLADCCLYCINPFLSWPRPGQLRTFTDGEKVRSFALWERAETQSPVTDCNTQCDVPDPEMSHREASSFTSSYISSLTLKLPLCFCVFWLTVHREKKLNTQARSVPALSSRQAAPYISYLHF